MPGYSPIDWDALKRELKAHPMECPGPGADSSSGVPAPATQSQSIEVSVHNVIMDADCRFPDQSEDTVGMPTGVLNPYRLWDGRLSDGSHVATGEYYVNTEVRWPDGRKDTTYQKIALIHPDCGG